ncbi:hypothetical protein [Ferrimonas balearica]|uniref:hypothetical protein n=1 Tax=Ferrimonas balearica TaxID=44012 RepID=UPI001C9A2B44|nr:hypothetical protein [Ferrimonas balearica]MBY5993228.1 hypothetical protein [Ferrimonas balearica]
MQLLVRNKVKDFAHWRRHLEADRARAAEYGLTLVALWQGVDDPNDAFFLLAVAERARAEAFMALPESAEVGRRSGVLEGEAVFVNDPNRPA